MLSPGDKLRNYEVLAELKPGGMGALYLARRVGAAGFTQHVAIKVIHPHLSSNETFVHRFVNEALLGARVEHPNVVRVEELGEEHGLYFLVMEYVHGCSVYELFEKLKKLDRTLTAEVAVAIAARVAEGLQAVHETKDASGKPLQLVHRDVSPQNILISTNGSVKLIDFGIAKATAAEVRASSGSLTGKVRYMSPEQAWGRPTDRRTDIYSLGIVLWELLTERRMFQRGEYRELLERVRSPTIVPPSRYRDDLPLELEAVVLRALRREPGERYATARDFRMSLYAAVPRAHDIDSSRLAELITEVMHDEILAAEQLLPKEACAPLLPKRADSVMTVTMRRPRDAAFAEPAAESIEIAPEPRSWRWIGAGTLVVLLALSATLFVLLLGEDAEEVPPVVRAPIRAPADIAAPILPPPPAIEEEETDSLAPEPPPKKRRIHRKRRTKGQEPKRVDGVPLLEDPGF